ncbi:mycoredoxin [Corynebacterium hansenii]|uniref:Mycoredoxin n=1 Tax=Corynebacterium hansenii TaxID=394964 RepID=A0ABV7ZKG0_9CORY|nr:mycoredoxin [Corynebacterium hansenii]WJY99127.1 Mycoredoxin 1 [Corynebacterium hansenii]
MSNEKITLPKTTEAVTIYATSWCPYCRALIGDLKKRGVPFEAWDVEKHADLASWVESVNGGNRVVPTVLYSDGSHATNPPAVEVELKYSELSKK